MEHNFKNISIFKRTNIDIYIFIICNNLKKNIKNISKLLNIENIPKKIFDDNKLEKTLYLDKFEVLFVNMESKYKCDNNGLYKIFGKLGKNMRQENKNILISLIGNDENILKNQIASYILGFYQYNDFKTDKDMSSAKKGITYFYYPKKKINLSASIYEAIVQNEIRSLINIPANILTSTKYADYIKKNIPSDIKITVLNEAKLKKLGCNLILGVNQGSKNKPLMVILEYRGQGQEQEQEQPIALIGKGVMFDSGGYNIKRGDFSDMKNDMTGSAIVYGIFKLLSKFNVKGHYIGLLPLVENMVDGNSIRPGDILKAYNGKTVEIIDTDAEGRLIMADALSYSAKYKPKLCIDIATLTGQAVSIFDSKSSVIIGNSNRYIQKMIKAGINNNEKIWELPMWEEYVNLTRSNIADIKNYTYESKASTIMAGAFLSQFIPDKTDWIHLDIAGIDTLSYDNEMRHSGATGEILRSLFDFLRNINKESYEK